MRFKIGIRDLALACLSVGMLILSFPKFDISVAAWFALVPLLIALEGKGLIEALLLSYLTGLIFNTGIFYWIWTIKAYNLVDYLFLEVIYLPLYITLWGLGLNFIRKRTGLYSAIIAPTLWVSLEYLRSHLSFLSLPWMLLGHSQYMHPSLIQISSITGVYGLSFLILLVNVAIAEMILYLRCKVFKPSSSPLPYRFPLAPLMIAGSLMIVVFFYGLSILSQGIKGEQMKVSLVQGNIPTERKWDRSYLNDILDQYERLTRIAAQSAPDLIIWPETAIPEDIKNNRELQRRIGGLAMDVKTYLLVGSGESAKFTDRRLANKYYNSMVLLSPQGKIEGLYRKIRLVPFGEYEPMKGIFTWPKAIASTVGNMLPGNQYTLFTVGQAAFGATICWENIFPEFVREFVKRGGSFIVSASDEGWFGDTAAPYQLLAMSVFRAAENRVAIARSSNSGVSSFIDPYGRIIERLKGPDQKELFVEGILSGKVIISKERTLYTTYGDLFAYSQIFSTISILFYSLKRGGSQYAFRSTRLPNN